MPRPPRLHVPGGYYHVMLRGNHREPLFAIDADRFALNDIVAEVLCQLDGRIHAFCWMTNHLHTLVQIGERPLGKIMQRIAVRYSKYRHRKLATSGHLFERRYRALLIDVDAYFLTLLRYIHLNPVKARMVTGPAEYPWSSHRAYLGETLGTDQFVAKLSVPGFKPRTTLTLEQLASQICAEQDISVELLRSASRQRFLAPLRLRIATEAVDQRIASLREVAQYFGREPTSLSELLVRYRR